MSALSAFLIVVAVLGFSGTAGYYQVRRAQAVCEAERARVLAEGRIRGSFAPTPRPAGETRPGTDFAQQDALELLYSIPAYDAELAAGRERLRRAVNDEQNGEQL